MRSSLILCFVLATVVSTYVVEARKEGCQCGGLGPGVNPCTCSEVVVKAAKLPKPVHFASCHAINEAAAQRAAVQAAHYSYGSSSSASNDAVKPGGIGSFGVSNGAYSSGSSSSGSSISGSSGISGRYSPYGPFGRGGLGGMLDGSYDLPGVSVVSGSGPACGCKQYLRKPGGPLAVRELLNSNTKVVPSFPPIGDLCYPSQTNPKTGELVRTITKVVPAYPGKVRCCEPVPQPCIRPPTPKCWCRREDTCGHQDPEIHAYDDSNSAASGSEDYRSSMVNVIGGYGRSSLVSGGYGGSSLVSGGYGGSSLASGGYGAFGRSSIVSEDFGDAESFDRDPRSSSSSGAFDDDDDLAPAQQVVPRLPADAVSLTLAYKNLVAPVIVHKQGRKYVPEDRLSFGPRTIPANGQVQKKGSNIPEEKLQTVERPVVELKVAPVGPITISDYEDNNEEDQLAELEALERERLEQEEQVEQTASSFISYGDLGYAPVCAKLVKAPSQPSVVSSPGGCLGGGGYGGPEAACGPLGPPRPDYIPGDVIVHQETIETEEPDVEDVVEIDQDDDDDDDDDDDVDVPRGFLSRLRLSARRHGGSPCSHS